MDLFRVTASTNDSSFSFCAIAAAKDEEHAKQMARATNACPVSDYERLDVEHVGAAKFGIAVGVLCWSVSDNRDDAEVKS